MLPQELLAEALWIEWWDHWGILHSEKIKELLWRYNLKLWKNKSITDVHLAFGRGLKNVHTYTSSAQIAQVAEEIDKVCIISHWEHAVARYKNQ